MAMSEVLLTKSETGKLTSHSDITRPVVEFLEAINRGDVDAAVERLAPDALHHGRISNYHPEGVRVLFGLLRTVFPDVRFDIREMRIDGNRVITRIVATGTHTGSYLGKPPTGRPVVWESIDISEVDDSGPAPRIIRRHWDLWGDPALWEEIGFTPAMMC
jgi:predicted ester cyclase